MEGAPKEQQQQQQPKQQQPHPRRQQQQRCVIKDPFFTFQFIFHPH